MGLNALLCRLSGGFVPGCRFVARLAFTAVTSRKQSTKLVLLRYLKSNLAGIDPVAWFAIRESFVPTLSLSLSFSRARILRFFGVTRALCHGGRM